MSENVRAVLRFLNNRMAAVSVEDRKKVMDIVESGEVSLQEVVETYIEACRRA